VKITHRSFRFTAKINVLVKSRAGKKTQTSMSYPVTSGASLIPTLYSLDKTYAACAMWASKETCSDSTRSMASSAPSYPDMLLAN